MQLCDPVTKLKGIGAVKAAAYARLKIFKIEHLINHYPGKYEDRTNIVSIGNINVSGDFCVIANVITDFKLKFYGGNKSRGEVVFSDGTGELRCVFFNQPYLKNSIRRGNRYLLFGSIELQIGSKTMINPDITKLGHDEKIQRELTPVYPLTAGITQKILRSNIKAALSELQEIEDYLPDWVKEKHGLLSLDGAIRKIHFPQNFDEAEKARQRLAFDELFLLQLGLVQLKVRRQESIGKIMDIGDLLECFLSALPFELTGAQQRVINEIMSDMRSGKPMNRLVQGDVGSGKTAVAAAAIYIAAKSGYQSALMAPTSILASQHYETLSLMFERLGVSCTLLTSAASAKEKRSILEKARLGEFDLLIGTHALIQQEVEFLNLGLMVCDEQHRFGVEQRAVLSGKGENPHVLVLSATPIPRSLGLVLYGDLDVSILDELPKGRQKVSTFIINEEKRRDCYRFVRDTVLEGGQAYIVCPLVEESENADRRAAEKLHSELSDGVFSGLQTAVIHGRMKQAEKDRIMSEFVENKIKILFATTVIEVGINVPNANIMLIEDAGRFGLSQLHQLRGRVGRGTRKSYCFLMSGEGIGYNRLKVLVKTNDGFEVAKEDYIQRGSGDLFGHRQHGAISFKAADLFYDMELSKKARKTAFMLLENDPYLKNDENKRLNIIKEERLYLGSERNIFN